MDASSSAGVSKGEVRLRKFAPDAGLAADSKFLLHWFGLSAKKNGCVDEELSHLLPWAHFAKDTALVDADMQYVPESESNLKLQKFANTTGLPIATTCLMVNPWRASFHVHCHGITSQGTSECEPA